MAYKRADWGPGDIAALPPTIGATSRAPTIGAEDVGRPIPSIDWDNGRYASLGGCAGCGLGNGEVGTSRLAIGAGLIVGGALMWWLWGRNKPLMGRL